MSEREEQRVEIEYSGPAFTVIEDGLIDDETLSPSAKIVYIKLFRHTTKNNRTAFPSIATIGRAVKLSRKTILKAIEELANFGLAKKERRTRDDGGRTSNLYTLYSYEYAMQKRAASTPSVNETQGGSVNETLPPGVNDAQEGYSSLKGINSIKGGAPPEFQLTGEPDPTHHYEEIVDTNPPPDTTREEVDAVIASLQDTARIYRERLIFSAKAREALREIIANFSGPITEQLFSEWLHTEGAGGEQYKNKLNIRTIIEADFLRFADKHAPDLLRQREVAKGLERTERQKENARFWAALVAHGEANGERRAAVDAVIAEAGHNVAILASTYARNQQSQDFAPIIAANKERFDRLIVDNTSTADPFAEIRHTLELSA